ncbi:MAG TPA: ABC transporter ATP-binding protein [Aggregatilinea sp.]|uniref:ABC transporter ATP-binding protein n=1 Tax=Aggregatilinea sp. TaxID=2806333 RepID=UPI002BB29F53|nr:ABC transporter ATP-binding protein [Aggregatilinea sp.]HML22427.1 ABC transporter ATP-binding protein [Aggregatilinea sp.]
MMRHDAMLFGSETRKAASTSTTLRSLWHYFKNWKLMLLLVVGLSIFSAWSQVKTADLVGQAVDCYVTPYIQQGVSSDSPAMSNMAGASESNCWYTDNTANLSRSETLTGLRNLILLLVGLFVLSAFASGAQFYAMRYAGMKVLAEMRIDIFRQIHRLSLGYYSKNEAGDVMSRLTNDTDTLQQAFAFVLVQVMRGIFQLAWLIYAMFTRNWTFALLSIIPVPFMVVATIWFSRQARKAYRVARREIGDVNADLQENIAGVREAQAFTREDENIARFRTVNAANRDANVRAVAFTSALSPALEALGYVSIVIVAAVGGIFMLRGQDLGTTAISLGLIITFISYTQQFNQPIQMISTLWTNLQNAIAGAERIFDFMGEKSTVQEKPGAIAMPPIEGHVELRDVTMSYNADEPVLQGVSLEAQPGQTIAIVGPTGAGKTTIINLLPRFYDVEGGAVVIDGHDVRDVTLDSLRSQIGLVLQDTFLFSDTVMNNIRYGRTDATDEDVIEAAKLAHADGFIASLPDGYNTILGERGSGLSQGQRQLIAIARAALGNPRLLILDEATSSVDTRTERLIQKALDELLKGRTSFVIAHRLSTIRNADQVYVLADGKIVEHGKHAELLDAKGFYYDLYMSQFRRDVPEPTVSGNGHLTPSTQPAS